MLSTLSTADVLVNSDGTSPFRTGETLRVWSTPFTELDLEKKLAVQVMGYFVIASSKVER
jgi:hypothetical protein